MRTEAPQTYQEVADLLREASHEGRRVLIRGGGTKPWGRPMPDPDLELSTEGLTGVVEHDAADLVAVVRAGTSLAEAQAVLAAEDQMLALDPPLGAGERATVGGVFATADSGPLRHGYKGPRDLLVGIRLALSDGSVVRSGGKVIKNVAGYDLGKLVCGSWGTLGVILEVAVRLHPLPPRTVSVEASSADPAAIGGGIRAISHAPLQAECLDVAWEASRGRVLVRFGGAAAEKLAERAAGILADAGLEARGIEDDEPIWEAQRRDQRADRGAVVRVSALQGAWEDLIAEAEGAGGSLVGRGALGLAWIRLPVTDDLPRRVEGLRRRLAPAPAVILDAPAEIREALDPWGPVEEGVVGLMRAVKGRFDPAGALNPGVYVGAI